MAVNLIAKSTVTIHAPISEVWRALTSPESIKQYVFGTEAISDWKQGSSLDFKGIWQGKQYHDKGIIQQVVPEKLLHYTYLSSFSGKEDLPENYTNIIYELTEDEGITTLTIKQENIESEKSREHSEQNWNNVLQNLKLMLESKLQPH